jgi:hypothetical protein
MLTRMKEVAHKRDKEVQDARPAPALEGGRVAAAGGDD